MSMGCLHKANFPAPSDENEIRILLSSLPQPPHGHLGTPASRARSLAFLKAGR